MRRFLVLVSSLLTACLPNVDVDASAVTEARVVAVRMTPAEAAPGQEIALEALVADPVYTSTSAAPSWSRCDAQKPLAELGPVSRTCLDDASARVALGQGLRVTTTVPLESCRLFGPNPPLAAAGAAPGRPVDADLTGGYFHPYLVGLGASLDATFARVFCGLANATQAESVSYATGYVRNENPTVEAIVLLRADGTAIGASSSTMVRSGEVLSLTARVPSCTKEPCAGAERYLRRGANGAGLETVREVLRISWSSSVGGVRDAYVGMEDGDATRSARTTWTAPAQAGTHRLWAVVRDDRGGVGWATREVLVAGP